MRVYKHDVAGDSVTVNVPETYADLQRFREWAEWAASRGSIALDTETTGLNIFADSFGLRTVQMGDSHTAWVIHWERGGYFQEVVSWFLRILRPRLLIHNAPFDWLVLNQRAGIPLESLAPITRDTRVMAHLCDPREPQDGGIGTGLKPLSARWIDPHSPDTQGDLTAVFRSLGLTKETGWQGIPLDHPTYNLYAGLDVILTHRLYPKLFAELSRMGVRPMLLDYEHELLRICATMQRTGMVLDEDYCRKLDGRLAEEADRFARKARRYGVENVNSNAQVIDALQAMGETLTETTKSGNLSVDKSVMMALADMHPVSWKRIGGRDANPLADAVIRSKRAGKWRKAYVEKFLTNADSSGRIHPTISTLKARTARMSISGDLAAQTLPSSDWMIRRALLADEGHVMVTCDFDAVEMRVLAALADVKRMKQVIAEGGDLHSFTRDLVFPNIPDPDEKLRKLCKGIGFGKVYGGGPETIAKLTGTSIGAVERAIAGYDRAYPEIRRFAARESRIAKSNGYVTQTITGRFLPLDRWRVFAVTNYQVQSAARDVLGQALIEMDSRGLTPYLRLPVHDETVSSVPRANVDEIMREIEACMNMTLGGVAITATAETKGLCSWGSLYGADF
ncbi:MULTISPECIES: DNA polymerase [unclassified Streptomyces]|uniref:DNA polymerase n=1 Tax=Streptomyces sp. NPDC056835 TaxID=3345956 RepID=UPI0036879E16